VSRVVWKFEVARANRTQMPRGARLLSVGQQDNRVMVWAEVDPRAAVGFRSVQAICTGDQVPPYGATFVGTAHLPRTDEVVHVYDGGDTT
jgi:hypothetical protein